MPGSQPIAFELNGVAHEVDVQQGEPLLYPLRRLGDVSVRYGCGAEQCGACRVLVDGQLAFACTMPAHDAQGRNVETAAGLDTPARRALIDFNAGQCGYCLPGIVVAAEALFRRQQFAPANCRRARKGAQAPTDADIRAALAPHLCRCGAHPRILRALASLACGARR